MLGSAAITAKKCKQQAIITFTSVVYLEGITMNAIFCPLHPKYKAIRKPRIKCKGCWEYYYEKRREDPDW